MNKPNDDGPFDADEVLAVLGPLDFDPACGWEPPVGRTECPLEAEWKARWSCCGEVQLFCNAHRSSMRVWLADAEKVHAACGKPGRPGLIVWAPLARVGWK